MKLINTEIVDIFSATLNWSSLSFFETNVKQEKNYALKFQLIIHNNGVNCITFYSFHKALNALFEKTIINHKLIISLSLLNGKQTNLKI